MRDKNRVKIEEIFGILSNLEWDFINQGFHALALHPEWLDNQSSAKQYIEELLVGLRSLTLKEQEKLVDTLTLYIEV